jgi:glutamine cyclotransferase
VHGAMITKILKPIPKNLKLYTTDLQNPVLKKYGFDSASFTTGAAGAVREILRAIQSEEFIEHCKG